MLLSMIFVQPSQSKEKEKKTGTLEERETQKIENGKEESRATDIKTGKSRQNRDEKGKEGKGGEISLRIRVCACVCCKGNCRSLTGRYKHQNQPSCSDLPTSGLYVNQNGQRSTVEEPGLQRIAPAPGRESSHFTEQRSIKYMFSWVSVYSCKQDDILRTCQKIPGIRLQQRWIDHCGRPL